MCQNSQCVDESFINEFDDCLWMHMKCCQLCNNGGNSHQSLFELREKFYFKDDENTNLIISLLLLDFPTFILNISKLCKKDKKIQFFEYLNFFILL